MCVCVCVCVYVCVCVCVCVWLKLYYVMFKAEGMMIVMLINLDVIMLPYQTKLY